MQFNIPVVLQKAFNNLWENNKSHSRALRLSQKTREQQAKWEENKPRARTIFGLALKFSVRDSVRWFQSGHVNTSFCELM